MAKGLCTQCCRRPVVEGLKTCQHCRDQFKRRWEDVTADPEKARIIKARRAATRVRSRAKYKAAGICVRCRQKPPLYEGGSLCDECLMLHRQYRREWRNRNAEMRLAIRAARETQLGQPLCAKCLRPAMDGKKLCEKHYAIVAKNIAKAREAMLQNIGNHPWALDNNLIFGT